MNKLIRFVPANYKPHQGSENYTPDHMSGLDLIQIELWNGDEWQNIADNWASDNVFCGFWFDLDAKENICFNYLKVLCNEFETAFLDSWGSVAVPDQDVRLNNKYLLKWMQFYRPDLFDDRRPDTLKLISELEHLRYCAYKTGELFKGLQSNKMINGESILQYLKMNDFID